MKAREAYDAKRRSTPRRSKLLEDAQGGSGSHVQDCSEEGYRAPPLSSPTLEPTDPVERRYITNDTTYEKLGEILAQNPNGILAHRDELVSLLKTSRP